MHENKTKTDGNMLTFSLKRTMVEYVYICKNILRDFKNERTYWPVTTTPRVDNSVSIKYTYGLSICNGVTINRHNGQETSIFEYWFKIVSSVDNIKNSTPIFSQFIKAINDVCYGGLHAEYLKNHSPQGSDPFKHISAPQVYLLVCVIDW